VSGLIRKRRGLRQEVGIKETSRSGFVEEERGQGERTKMPLQGSWGKRF